MSGYRCAVRFTEGMAAGDQRDDLFIVHGHVAEGGTNGSGSGERVAAGVRAFRVNVDQTHFGGTQRLLRQAFRVTMFEPGFFMAPVNVQIRFPDIFTTGAEAEGAETGVFQRDVTGQHIEVSPGDFLAVFLFYRPQQATGFIEADVIRPGVQRRKALLSTACATATVNGTIGACTVPGHTNKQPDVAAPVCRPPLL